MAKVAVLTMQRSPNYGAVLQAYALQKAIVKLGAECEILDLLRPVHPGYKYTNRNTPLPPYSAKTENNDSLALRERVKATLIRPIELLVKSLKNRYFRNFERTHLRFSEQSFYSSDELYEAELDYNYFVTGSDQVWNPTYPYSPEPYFLTFVAKGIPRIAYAPSFGVSEIDKAVQPLYKRWLNDINHLSVRESQGAKIIFELTGRDAQVVLDPTFLLSKKEWQEFAIEPNTKYPYIFCYSLGDVPGLMKICHHAQQKTGFPIYKIGNTKDLWNRKVKAIVNAGPQEFVGYIMNAAMVITNSFHGTALSINMQRPFYTVPSPVIGVTSRNSRLESILGVFSLKNRLYRPEDELPSSRDFDVEYDKIKTKLELERSNSLSYLKHAICN